MSSKVVYIAGPMRGVPEDNFPAFDDCKKRLIKTGLFDEIINPADLDRADSDEIKNLSQDEKQAIYAERDCRAVLRSTHVVMLPFWQLSRGARVEYFLARWTNKTVWDSEWFMPISPTKTVVENFYMEDKQDFLNFTQGLKELFTNGKITRI